MKHESAIISIKYNHRRALTSISEAQEQLSSSKDISEAHRVIFSLFFGRFEYLKKENEFQIEYLRKSFYFLF